MGYKSVRKAWNRGLALLMLFVLVLGMLPSAALADDNTSATDMADESEEPANDPEETNEVLAQEPEQPTAESAEATAYINSISGTIWMDENENGVYDSGESPVSDYEVSLYYAGSPDTAVATAITDANGKYLFENLTPDDYVVMIPLSQTVGGTEYLVPLVGISRDNKFALDTNTYDSYTDIITIGLDTVAMDYNAGVRTPAGIMPLSGGYIVTRDDNGVNLGATTDLATAVSYCLTTTACTITATNNDTDMGTTYVSIPSGKTITLTSAVNNLYTITQRTTSTSAYNDTRHFSVSGTLILENIILKGVGSSGDYNGGVYVGSGGKLTMKSGASIQNCYGNEGGGVYNSGNLYMTGTADISGNTAALHGGGIINHGTFRMDGGTIGSNIANQYGGGVINYADFAMNGGTISGNTAYWGGGVSNFSNSTTAFTMSGGIISNNTASFDGGGVLNYTGYTYTMSDGTISGNKANVNGGGVMNYGRFNMSGGTIGGSNSADANIATNGGGMCNSTNGEFNMDDGIINGNTATSNGGGVWNSKTFKMSSNAIIRGNKAEYGGGVYIDSTNGDFQMSGGIIGGITYTEANTADEEGGGVYINSGSNFDMDNGDISGNIAQKNGGGVCNTYGTFHMDGGAVNDNTITAGSGGGVCSSGSFTMTGTAKIIHNTATNSSGDAYGGGVVNYGLFTMDAGDISGNAASTGGGGVSSSGTFKMNGGTIGGNTSTDANTASFGGGVINYSAFDMSGTATIKGNEAISSGGGVFSSGTFTLISGTISGNKATNGGGVYQYDTSYIFTMSGGSVTNNTATVDGGGIYSSDYSYVATPVASTSYRNISISGGSVSSNTSGATYPAPINATDFSARGSNSFDGSLLTNNEINYRRDLIVTYDSNGGTGSYTVIVSYNDSYTVLDDSAATITRAGYKFTGWNTQADGNGTPYTAGDSFTINGDVTLYAQWVLAAHTVTYDANSGTGSHTDNVSYNDSYTVLSDSAAGITRTGYTFTGWNTQADGNGTPYTAGDSFTINGDVTLYAQWVLAAHTVTYDANSGTGSYTDNVYYNDSYTVLDDSATAITRTGYNFTGWNTQADGNGTPYTAGDSLTIKGDVTLYAQWVVVAHTVTYDANSGLGSYIDNVSYNDSYTVLSDLATGITKTGYNFTGWNTQANGTGTPYTAGDSFTINGDVTLYAQWRANWSNARTVTYNANSGTGSYIDNVSYNDSYTVLDDSAAGITRTGYNFTGWNTQADGNGTPYTAGDSFTINGDVTLYAQWAAAHTVTYNSNGGMGSYTDNVSYNDSYTVLDDLTTGITRTGYTFTGWNTQANGTGTPYTAGDSFTINGDVTLYAQWRANWSNARTVTYNANSGTGSYIDNVSYNDSYTVLDDSAAGITRTGYNFTGWNTQADGNGTPYTAGDSFTINGDVTLYAQWAAAHTVSYNSNGGMGSYTDNVYYNDSYTVLDDLTTGITRTGYTFTGWNTQANGTGTPYTAGDSFTINGDVTLYAQWRANWSNARTVTYNANSGTGSYIDNVSYNDSYTVLDNSATGITRTGYNFTGWNTQADGNGTPYTAGDSFTINGDVTLYAQWAAAHTVTYNSNGGMGSYTDNVSYNDSYTVLDDSATGITRTRYTFAGWNTQADGNGTPYSVGAVFTIQGNETLYAQWRENWSNAHTVTYDANGGSGSHTDNVSYNDSYTVLDDSTTGITRTGYTFTGWNTLADGNGTSYSIGAIFTIDGDITLYAQWTMITTKSSISTSVNTGDSNNNLMWFAGVIIAMAALCYTLLYKRKHKSNNF